MSRWGDIIPHQEDDPGCLCGCQDEPERDGEGEVPPAVATALMESIDRLWWRMQLAALGHSVPVDVVVRLPS